MNRVKQFIVGTILPNKTAVMFFSFVTASSLAMGGYILLAPSSQNKIARAQFPTVMPSPVFPTDEPTPTYEPPTPTPIEELPLPTEEPTPTPSEIPTPTLDPTENWNTYSNTQYGYSIKYPLNWNVTDLGELEPKVPNHIVFNQNTASSSARYITISVSTRTYQEQLTIGGTSGTPITAGGLMGTAQSLKDSDGNTSIAIILQRISDILILRAKTAYSPILYQMLPTLVTN